MNSRKSSVRRLGYLFSYTEPWHAADLRELHNGDLDDLSDFFSPAALSFLRTVCASSPIPSLQPGPTASEVKQQNATGLGDLMVRAEYYAKLCHLRINIKSTS